MTLLAAFNFDEASGDVIDRSGNGRDWALNTGAARTASGHTLGGLTKSSTGFCVIAATAFGQTTNRTFMFWMQGLGNSVWWLRWKNNAADTGTWGIYNLGGNINLRIRKGGSNTNITFPTPADGLWHHYAGTYDGTNSRLYVDGVLRATSGSVTAPLDTADLIDCMETSLNTQVMDDLRILDEVYSQAQIAAAMDTPVSSSSGSTGTLAATLPELVADIDGTSQSSGTLSATLPALTMQATASSTAVGGLVAMLPELIFDAEAQATSQGILAGQLPMPEMDFVGEVESPITGVLAAQLPLPQMFVTGLSSSSGILIASLPDLELSFTGISEHEENGELNILLPMFIAGVQARGYRMMQQQRKLTRDFIASSPIFIELVPGARVKKPSGGTETVHGVPRPTQMFRLIPMSHTERPRQSTSAAAAADSGVQRRYDYTLLGEWDAVMEIDDSWTTPDGQLLVIENLVSDNGYEKKGLVISYGRVPTHAPE